MSRIVPPVTQGHYSASADHGQRMQKIAKKMSPGRQRLAAAALPLLPAAPLARPNDDTCSQDGADPRIQELYDGHTYPDQRTQRRYVGTIRVEIPASILQSENGIAGSVQSLQPGDSLKFIIAATARKLRRVQLFTEIALL